MHAGRGPVNQLMGAEQLQPLPLSTPQLTPACLPFALPPPRPCLCSYVGGAPGKIDLYVGKEVVRRGINNETACDELLELIKVRGGCLAGWELSWRCTIGCECGTCSGG